MRRKILICRRSRSRRRRRRRRDRGLEERLAAGGEQGGRRRRREAARGHPGQALERAEEGAREPRRRGGGRGPPHEGAGRRAQEADRGGGLPDARRLRLWDSATAAAGRGCTGLRPSRRGRELPRHDRSRAPRPSSPAGKTLADVAKAKGKSVDGLVSALVADEKKELDAAVEGRPPHAGAGRRDPREREAACSPTS